MSQVRRLFWLSLCCLAAEAACFGGPTSEWPKDADGEDGDGTGTPPSQVPGLDAGASTGGQPFRDSSVIGPVPTDPCSSQVDAGVDDAGAGRVGIFSEQADGGVSCR